LGKYGKYLLELDLISELGKVNVENMIVGKKIIKKEWEIIFKKVEKRIVCWSVYWKS
jgi:hypothetical protein